MSTAQIIDGKTLAASLMDRIGVQVASLTAMHGRSAGLALIQVGDDRTSAGYVNSKRKQAQAIGFRVIDHALPADIELPALLALIADLNDDSTVQGILIQLPLPAPLPTDRVLAVIRPDKDVDGLHPENLGRLAGGGDSLVACTPLACMALIGQVRPNLRGLHAVVLGRSRLVGLPLAHLLLRAGATLTILHSASRDEAAVCRHGDVLVSAVGQPGLVRGDWIKPGATVIDVGLNRVDGTLVGDIVAPEAAAVAGALTPVPGGVGPMTIAMLMSNVAEAYCRQRGVTYVRPV